MMGLEWFDKEDSTLVLQRFYMADSHGQELVCDELRSSWLEMY